MSAIRSRIRPFWVAAVLAAMVIGTVPGTASAAARLTFGVDWWGLQLHSDCIRGTAAADATVRITWKSAGGALKARVDLPTQSHGYWSYCSDTRVLAVGDTIKAADAIGSRTFKMPKVTLFGDRINDLFHGRAPANSTGQIYWHAGLYADYYQGAEVAVNAEGVWSIQHEDIGDLIGGIDATISLKTPQGDHVDATGTTPFVTVTIGKSTFSGGAGAYQGVTVTLRDPVTNVIKARGSTVADEWGSFEYGDSPGTFTDDQGQPVPVQVGDRIKSKLASDMNWIVPNIEATANIATDHVTGRCFDNGLSDHSGVVRVYRTGVQRGFALMNTDAAGFFDVDFSRRPAPFYDPANIKRGDRIVVMCRLTNGDNVLLPFRVP